MAAASRAIGAKGMSAGNAAGLGEVADEDMRRSLDTTLRDSGNRGLGGEGNGHQVGGMYRRVWDRWKLREGEHSRG